jgi:TrmH family RNA methyltransferase
MKTKPLSISSAQNLTYKKIKSLLTSKGIKTEKLILLSGAKIIQEALNQKSIRAEFEVSYSDQFKYSCSKKIILTKPLFEELDVIGTHDSLLVCSEPPKLLPNQKGLSVLLPLGDPNNLGAAIRSCVGFGVDEIVLLKEACHPFLPKVIKASAGAVLKAPLTFGPSIKEVTTKNLVCLDQKGELLQDFNWPKSPLQLLVGEEGPGLSQAFECKKISIPTENIESLNAAHALSIVLFYRQEKLKARI